MFRTLKQNYFTNNNFKNKNMQSISNCKKYIEILTSKPKNKSIEPKKGVVQDEIGMSSLKINKKMSKNIANDILNHLNLFSSNNFSFSIFGGNGIKGKSLKNIS